MPHTSLTTIPTGSAGPAGAAATPAGRDPAPAWAAATPAGRGPAPVRPVAAPGIRAAVLDAATLATPAGPLTVLTDPDEMVRAAGFTADLDALLDVVHPGLRGPVRTRAELGPVTVAVRSYLDGELTAIDWVPVLQHTGGEFMAHAWRRLREIPPGAPVTYTGFAGLAGRPSAVRAAAAACARNAAALFVPCHRVLRTDGGLGGYRWGLPVKRWLLAHERSGGPVDDQRSVLSGGRES